MVLLWQEGWKTPSVTYPSVLPQLCSDRTRYGTNRPGIGSLQQSREYLDIPGSAAHVKALPTRVATVAGPEWVVLLVQILLLQLPPAADHLCPGQSVCEGTGLPAQEWARDRVLLPRRRSPQRVPALLSRHVGTAPALRSLRNLFSREFPLDLLDRLCFYNLADEAGLPETLSSSALNHVPVMEGTVPLLPDQLKLSVGIEKCYPSLMTSGRISFYHPF